MSMVGNVSLPLPGTQIHINFPTHTYYTNSAPTFKKGNGPLPWPSPKFMDQPAWSDSEDDSKHRHVSQASSEYHPPSKHPHVNSSSRASLVAAMSSKVVIGDEAETHSEASENGMSLDDASDGPPLIVHADSGEMMIMDQLRPSSAESGEIRMEAIRPSSAVLGDVMIIDEDPQAAKDDSSSSDEVEQSCQRYFLENSGPKCFNCGLPGHMSRDCKAAPSLPCFLCGRIGHQRSDCPEDLCHNCGRPGHMRTECRQPRKRRLTSRDLCNRCSLPGHYGTECSLRWRRYVFIKSIEKSAREKLLPIKRCCYNCAGLDHLGDECPYTRKRPDWTIFHEPDSRFLRYTEIKEQQHDQSNGRRDEDNRSDRREEKKPVRDNKPSPNWRRMRDGPNGPVIITESNYYDHFDGSYKGKTLGNGQKKPQQPEQKSGGDTHRSRSGYGHSSSSKGRKDKRK